MTNPKFEPFETRNDLTAYGRMDKGDSIGVSTTRDQEKRFHHMGKASTSFWDRSVKIITVSLLNLQHKIQGLDGKSLLQNELTGLR